MKLAPAHIAAIIVGCFVLVGGVAAWQLAGGQAAPQSDEAFLASVREEAEEAPSAAEQDAGALPGVADDQSKVAEIRLPSAEFDMGMIPNDRVTTKEVPVYNDGMAPLRVSRVTTSCGCTQGRIVNDVIPPGESGTLRVSVDPFRIPGFSSSKVLTVYSNDVITGPVQLAVHAKVEPEFELEPENIDFGDVPRGETGEASLIIRQVQDKPFEVTNVRLFGGSEQLSVDYEKRPKDTWQQPDKEEYAVHVTLAPDTPKGPLLARVMLETDLPRVKAVPIAVRANITSFYTINPKFVALRGITPGTTRENILAITADRPFDLEPLTANVDVLTLNTKPMDEGHGYIVDATIPPTAEPGPIRDRVSITMTAGDQTFTEEVPFVVFVQAPPSPTPSPAPADSNE